MAVVKGFRYGVSPDPPQSLGVPLPYADIGEFLILTVAKTVVAGQHFGTPVTPPAGADVTYGFPIAG